MSKRCELRKRYYQANGKYRGNGKYNDEYVRWLEDQILDLRIHAVVGRSEQLVCNCQGCGEVKKIEYCEKCYAENLPDISN
jgi:hypothetical protein